MEKLIGFNPPQKLIEYTSTKSKPPKCLIRGPKRPLNWKQNMGLPAVPPPTPASSIADTNKSDTGSDSESNESDDDEEELGWKFHRTFINKETGMGLVAKEYIPAGSIIYADRLIWTTKAEEEAAHTINEVNSLLGTKVSAMGPQWHRAYTSMPNTQEKELGVMGGIWDTFQLPMYWDGELGGVLGINLAFTNHSCLPNSYMTLVNEHPGEGGQRLMHEKPTLAGAVVRCFVDILKGQEITISYFYGKGEADYRRLYALDVLGFRCACRYCLYPNAEVEDSLGTYYRLDNILNNPNLISRKPAMAYQTAHQISLKLAGCGIADPRNALIWAKCALIAGFHSDIGRIRCFLLMVLKLTEMLQGPTGPLFCRALKWFDSMSVMPGFGTTTRGLSSMRDAHVFIENKKETRTFLFMEGARPDEYIHVNRYRRVSVSDGEKADDHESRLEIIQDQSNKPNLNLSTKKKKMIKRKPRAKCNDPEKDFLALWLRVVNDFIDHGSHEPNMKKTGKNTKDTSEESASMERNHHNNHIRKYTLAQAQESESAQKQPLVRDVGARRKVTVQHVQMEMRMHLMERS